MPAEGLQSFVSIAPEMFRSYSGKIGGGFRPLSPPPGGGRLNSCCFKLRYLGNTNIFLHTGFSQRCDHLQWNVTIELQWMVTPLTETGKEKYIT